MPLQRLDKLEPILWGAFGNYFKVIHEKSVIIPTRLNFVQGINEVFLEISFFYEYRFDLLDTLRGKLSPFDLVGFELGKTVSLQIIIIMDLIALKDNQIFFAKFNFLIIPFFNLAAFLNSLLKVFDRLHPLLFK